MPKKKNKETAKLDSCDAIVLKNEIIEESASNIDNKEQKKKENDLTAKNPVNAMFYNHSILTEESDKARELYNQSRFGSLKEGKIELSPVEAYYLLEKKKIILFDTRNKIITLEKLRKNFLKLEKNFFVRYSVFKDIRDRGYIIKTALKFGADFRVYDRGVKPGEDHAKWIVYPVSESEHLTWYEFAAKNRVAHSTKKRLLIGIVDAEGDVTYYEIKWTRP